MAEGCYIPQLDVEDFSANLLDRGFDATVTRAFEKNRISGAVFVKLTDDELKELVPLIGVQLGVRELLHSARQVRIW